MRKHSFSREWVHRTREECQFKCVSSWERRRTLARETSLNSLILLTIDSNLRSREVFISSPQTLFQQLFFWNNQNQSEERWESNYSCSHLWTSLSQFCFIYFWKKIQMRKGKWRSFLTPFFKLKKSKNVTDSWTLCIERERCLIKMQQSLFYDDTSPWRRWHTTTPRMIS
jgi:hypothetical protein